jgi:coenzyme F420-reducing hydrogenase alpha subunit
MTHRSSNGGRVLTVDTLARVEGEGAMHVHVVDGRVTDVQLRIFEPPRFFEAFLRGRAWTEPPDITARICGICPVAYQMSSCLAIEDACGVTVTEEIRALRRLLYCGEWIESHALHVYLLHAPDFLGYAGAVELARDHPDVVEQGLRLKKAGNAIMSVVGGRSIHPVNVRIGGSTASRRRPSWPPCGRGCCAPGTTRWPRPPWSAGSTSRTSSSPTSTSPCGPRAATRWRPARS